MPGARNTPAVEDDDNDRLPFGVASDVGGRLDDTIDEDDDSAGLERALVTRTAVVTLSTGDAALLGLGSGDDGLR